MFCSLKNILQGIILVSNIFWMVYLFYYFARKVHLFDFNFYICLAPRPTAFKEEENPWPPAVVFLTTTQRYATLLRELMGFSQDPECEDFHYNPEHGGT